MTNAFLWLSIACLLWDNEKIIKEMFVLPVTALFAFTTVRANMPGAPAGFGTIVIVHLIRLIYELYVGAYVGT